MFYALFTVWGATWDWILLVVVSEQWRNDLFGPVNVITSSLLGGEIVSFTFRIGRNSKTQKCLYLGQNIEFQKI